MDWVWALLKMDSAWSRDFFEVALKVFLPVRSMMPQNGGGRSFDQDHAQAIRQSVQVAGASLTRSGERAVLFIELFKVPNAKGQALPDLPLECSASG
jgi:hypothetical protein